MKKVLFLLIISTGIIVPSNAQNNTYGISFGLGNGFIMKKALAGDASYDLNTGFSVGLQYTRKITNRLHLLTGVNMYKNNVKVTPGFHPNADMTPKNYNLRLLYIPVFLKMDLSRTFFINGGLIGDIDISRDRYIANQSGIGAGLGIGAAFSLSGKLSFQLNPYINFHGLVMTDKENYPERVSDLGIRLVLVTGR